MEEIEQQAEAVLARVPDWLWNGETLPVPVDDIADTCFGLLIREVEEMTMAPGAPPLEPGQSLSGLLLAGPGEIWVNAEEAQRWPPRRRFTIGHELGHWVIHRPTGQQALFCRHGSIDENQQDAPAPKPDDDARQREREANAFAAALTMPAHLIQKHYERLRRDPECHPQMCKLFAASGAAMGRRLHAVIQ